MIIRSEGEEIEEEEEEEEDFETLFVESYDMSAESKSI